MSEAKWQIVKIICPAAIKSLFACLHLSHCISKFIAHFKYSRVHLRQRKHLHFIMLHKRQQKFINMRWSVIKINFRFSLLVFEKLLIVADLSWLFIFHRCNLTLDVNERPLKLVITCCVAEYLCGWPGRWTYGSIYVSVDIPNWLTLCILQKLSSRKLQQIKTYTQDNLPG